MTIFDACFHNLSGAKFIFMIESNCVASLAVYFDNVSLKIRAAKKQQGETLVM